jgi:hypothetical protein
MNWSEAKWGKGSLVEAWFVFLVVFGVPFFAYFTISYGLSLLGMAGILAKLVSLGVALLIALILEEKWMGASQTALSTSSTRTPWEHQATASFAAHILEYFLEV